MKFMGVGVKANIYQNAICSNRSIVTSMRVKVQRWKLGRLVSW